MPDQNNLEAGPGPVAQAKPGAGYQVAITRDGGRVTIVLTSASDYAAMQLYDTLVRSAEAGSIRLDLAPR